MLFALNWVNRDGATEERDKRIYKLFTNWKPPAGFEFKGFYDYADGTGGVAIVEAASPEAVLEVCATWSVFLEFTVRPIVPSDKATPIFGKVIAWRDSVR
jgi:hypothetical protein